MESASSEVFLLLIVVATHQHQLFMNQDKYTEISGDNWRSRRSRMIQKCTHLVERCWATCGI